LIQLIAAFKGPLGVFQTSSGVGELVFGKADGVCVNLRVTLLVELLGPVMANGQTGSKCKSCQTLTFFGLITSMGSPPYKICKWRQK